MSSCPVKVIIVFQAVEDTKVADQLGIRVIKMEDVIRMGQENPKETKKPTPSDLASIMYTSGTTGNPSLQCW